MTNSLRIQEICNQVCYNIVAEIGCDHAYITKTLLDTKKVTFAYLTDISFKCLQKAIVNLNNYKNSTCFCEGDGLKALNKAYINKQSTFLKDDNNLVTSKLKENKQNAERNLIEINLLNNSSIDLPEIQQVIIAGMGGQEIIKILSQSESRKYDNYILQPQKNAVELRIYLQQNGYEILKDELVQEGKMFYFIIKTKKTNQPSKPLSTLELYFGKPTNKQTFKNYLNFELEKRKEIAKQKKFIENETLIRLIEQYLLEL